MLSPCIGYQAEVVEDKVVALACVAAVNVGVHILDVDNKGIDHREQSLDVGRRHVERRLKIELPCRATQFAKLAYKLRTQARLAATEGNTAVCGDEIKLVDACFGIQFLR